MEQHQIATDFDILDEKEEEVVDLNLDPDTGLKIDLSNLDPDKIEKMVNGRKLSLFKKEIQTHRHKNPYEYEIYFTGVEGVRNDVD